MRKHMSRRTLRPVYQDEAAKLGFVPVTRKQAWVDFYNMAARFNGVDHPPSPVAAEKFADDTMAALDWERQLQHVPTDPLGKPQASSIIKARFRKVGRANASSAQ